MKFFPRPTVLSMTSLIAGFLCLSSFAMASDDGVRVEGIFMPPPLKAAPIVTWRSGAEAGATAAIAFPPFAEARLKALREENSSGFQAKPLKIGVNRGVATEADLSLHSALQWQSIGNGSVARLVVTSSGARALRVALQLNAFPDNAELRFAGSDAPDRIIGIISGREASSLRDDAGIYWTPMTEGESQTVELYLPADVAPETVKVSASAASHIFVSPADGFDTAAVLKASGYCEINVACKAGSLGTAFQNASKAVARMAFSDSLGSYTCTGTLLNNSANDNKPYFWSAAHCISTQSEANTLNTYWFDETTTCSGSQRSSNYRQLSGGATLLHVNKSAETLLLRLNNSPPAGAYFAGWDSARFSSGDMIGIHHPKGDFKKVSIGKGTGNHCGTLFTDSVIDTSKLSIVTWTEAATEQGSSGSGLFTLSDGRYYLRGGLMGGTSSCSTVGRPVSSGNADCYSRLDLVYSDIKQYLNPASSQARPTREYGGAWYNPAESGWGLVMAQYPSKHLFVSWYTFDTSGRAYWYIFQGTNWTGQDIWTAPITRYTGPAWGTSFNPSQVNYVQAGTATLTFTSASTGRFQYSVDGVSRTVDIYKLE